MTGASPGGMILFDKPQGWTSHDAAEAFRRMLPPGTKVGHCGALDPVATGLLVLLVGPCTRLQAMMQGLDKTYSGVIRLGVETDTGDVTGKVLREGRVPPLGLKVLQSSMDAFLGKVDVPVPAYSAVKHKGRALYEYARKGQPVPAKRRVSRIDEWRALSYKEPDLEHAIRCSSGTYIRALAGELGARLGCGAVMLTLRRDSVASLRLSDALTLEDAKKLTLNGLNALLERSLKALQEVAIGPAR
ncbi:MAG: tRNA pseudouridine(55) synthase TruB [Elusimicrobia bacterium]|nr:tRNA pseudouridine(55) synthase TruB [Elusimicrobiota bacterium]